MAIQKEPGQKGVNWSNIAVGACLIQLYACTLVFSENWVAGAIMNMVLHYFIFE
jgi:hypothetical protein